MDLDLRCFIDMGGTRVDVQPVGRVNGRVHRSGYASDADQNVAANAGESGNVGRVVQGRENVTASVACHRGGSGVQSVFSVTASRIAAVGKEESRG